MLVALYIISAVAGAMFLVFEYQEKFKEQLTSALIAIFIGFAFCIPMIIKIVNSSTVGFWPIFGVLSLMVWQFAFLRDDVENLIGYEFCILIASILLCLFCNTPSDYVVSCPEDHISKKNVPIITTVNGTELGESIYGDGFVVGLINYPASNKRIYQYYYRSENGSIQPKEINANQVTINYVESTVSPYIEITSTQNCFGYTKETKRHIFIGTRETYILYIPEGSIKNVLLIGSN